jgi:hypothetical protein
MSLCGKLHVIFATFQAAKIKSWEEFNLLEFVDIFLGGWAFLVTPLVH